MLAQIHAALRQDPADARSLEDWAARLAVSSRTLARLFRHELQMTFRQFRTQVRLHAAFERLAAGLPITIIAHELGFSSASNFISMFRRATGRTPGTYFIAASPRLR